MTYHLSPTDVDFVNHVSTIKILNTVQHALSYLKWEDAMAEEMQALEKNRT